MECLAYPYAYEAADRSELERLSDEGLRLLPCL